MTALEKVHDPKLSHSVDGWFTAKYLSAKAYYYSYKYGISKDQALVTLLNKRIEKIVQGKKASFFEVALTEKTLRWFEPKIIENLSLRPSAYRDRQLQENMRNFVDAAISYASESAKKEAFRAASGEGVQEEIIKFDTPSLALPTEILPQAQVKKKVLTSKITQEVAEREISRLLEKSDGRSPEELQEEIDSIFSQAKMPEKEQYEFLRSDTISKLALKAHLTSENELHLLDEESDIEEMESVSESEDLSDISVSDVVQLVDSWLEDLDPLAPLPQDLSDIIEIVSKGDLKSQVAFRDRLKEKDEGVSAAIPIISRYSDELSFDELCKLKLDAAWERINMLENKKKERALKNLPDFVQAHIRREREHLELPLLDLPNEPIIAMSLIKKWRKSRGKARELLEPKIAAHIGQLNPKHAKEFWYDNLTAQDLLHFPSFGEEFRKIHLEALVETYKKLRPQARAKLMKKLNELKDEGSFYKKMHQAIQQIDEPAKKRASKKK